MKFGMRLANPIGEVDAQAIYARIDPTWPAQRIISWTPQRETGVLYHVVLDTHQAAVLPVGETELAGVHQAVRRSIYVIETIDEQGDEDLGKFGSGGADRATLTWDEVTGSPDYYVISRKPSGGAYAAVSGRIPAGETHYEVQDAPIADGDYTYKVTAYDAAGNAQDSDEEAAAIAGAPDPPTGLVATVAAGVVTLSWSAPATGADHYAVRWAKHPAYPRLDDAAEATPSGTSWQHDLSGQTGVWEYLVRSVSAGGIEEQGLAAMVIVELSGGTEVSRPNRPQIISAVASAGGTITVTAWYDPAGAPVTATLLRLYVNDGADGEVDYDTSVGSAALATGGRATVATATTSALTDALTYRVAARARTAGGVEDDGTDYEEVTVDATAPGAADITVAVT